MNRWLRCSAALVVLALAACGDASSDSPLAPARPSFDSGPIVGGNSMQTMPSDTTNRSGPIVGGN
ncbi:MAG TPA: hypothetical protein VF263_26655 [Longimicrobiaceae bacterium]